MPWYKIEDEFDDKQDTHARADALGLFVCMGTWCSRNLTDGVILKSRTKGLPGYSDKRIKLLLLDRGTDDGKPWVLADGDNYIIRNFLAYNPSRDQVLAEREANAKRIGTWRVNNKKGKRVTPLQPPLHTPDVTPLPTLFVTPLVTGASRIPYPDRDKKQGVISSLGVLEVPEVATVGRPFVASPGGSLLKKLAPPELEPDAESNAARERIRAQIAASRANGEFD